MLSGCKEPPGKGQLPIVIKLKHISVPGHGTIDWREKRPRSRAGAFCRERADLSRFPGM